MTVGLLKKAYGSNVPLTMIWVTVQDYLLMTIHLYRYEKVDIKMLNYIYIISSSGSEVIC